MASIGDFAAETLTHDVYPRGSSALKSCVLAVRESELDERVLQMGMKIRGRAASEVGGTMSHCWLNHRRYRPQTFENVTSPIRNRSVGLLGGGRSAWCSCPNPQLQCDHPFPSSVKSSSRHL